ncbi:MAG: OmpA family protein [Thiotrichales bacterium]
MNLVEMMQDQLGPGLAAQASNLLGVGRLEAESEVRQTLLVLLNGFTNRAANPAGAGRLLAALSGTPAAAQPETQDFARQTATAGKTIPSEDGDLLRKLFGDDREALTEHVGTLTGLPAERASALLGLAAPAVAARLKQIVADDQLDNRALSDLLARQRPLLEHAIGARVFDFGADPYRSTSAHARVDDASLDDAAMHESVSHRELDAVGTLHAFDAIDSTEEIRLDASEVLGAAGNAVEPTLTDLDAVSNQDLAALVRRLANAAETADPTRSAGYTETPLTDAGATDPARFASGSTSDEYADLAATLLRDDQSLAATADHLRETLLDEVEPIDDTVETYLDSAHDFGTAAPGDVTEMISLYRDDERVPDVSAKINPATDETGSEVKPVADGALAAALSGLTAAGVAVWSGAHARVRDASVPDDAHAHGNGEAGDVTVGTNLGEEIADRAQVTAGTWVAAADRADINMPDTRPPSRSDAPTGSDLIQALSPDVPRSLFTTDEAIPALAQDGYDPIETAPFQTTIPEAERPVAWSASTETREASITAETADLPIVIEPRIDASVPSESDESTPPAVTFKPLETETVAIATAAVAAGAAALNAVDASSTPDVPGVTGVATFPDVELRAATPEIELHVDTPAVTTPEADSRIAIPAVGIPEVELPAATPEIELHVDTPTVTTPEADPRIAIPAVGIPEVEPRILTPTAATTVDSGPDDRAALAASAMPAGAAQTAVAGSEVAANEVRLSAGERPADTGDRGWWVLVPVLGAIGLALAWMLTNCQPQKPSAALPDADKSASSSVVESISARPDRVPLAPDPTMVATVPGTNDGGFRASDEGASQSATTASTVETPTAVATADSAASAATMSETPTSEPATQDDGARPSERDVSSTVAADAAETVASEPAVTTAAITESTSAPMPADESTPSAASGNAMPAAPSETVDLPNGTQLALDTGGAVDQIVQYLRDANAAVPQSFTLRGLNFETASSRISADSQKIVADLAAALNAYPNVTILLEGHTDDRGDPAFNKRLSGDRAAAVRNALIEANITGGRITTAGLGADRPIADNGASAGRQENRRVEVIVTAR